MGKTLSLFEAVGIEIEYMIVSRDTLNVLPVTDELIKKVANQYVNEVERGRLAWSNELALHVVELKTNGPSPGLTGLAEAFHADIRAINELLENMGGQLLGSAMHPWMDPDSETRLWPHEYNPIYESYNRIFDCRGHGWSNLQSMHINLPFANEEEFVRLHNAIRLLLPLLPAIAASSPYADGCYQGMMDYRLDVYRHNADRIPSITGNVIPESVASVNEYHQHILEPMYRDIAALDKEDILQEEWLNSRGAIARFDRNAIEIRVLDCQESPRVDIAIADAVIAVLKTLIEYDLPVVNLQTLLPIYESCVREGGRAMIDSSSYMKALKLNRTSSGSAAEIWSRLLDQSESMQIENARLLEMILSKGCLAQRLSNAIGKQAEPGKMKTVYAELMQHLQAGEPYIG